MDSRDEWAGRFTAVGPGRAKVRGQGLGAMSTMADRLQGL